MILLDKFKLNKGEKLPDVERKIQQICTLLGINPSWLMMVMWSESRLNTQAVNSQPGDPTNPLLRVVNRATGLIQFMPETARKLGTTTLALYQMSIMQQLDYVFAYFRPYAGRIKSYYDLYMITFFPDALGRSDDYVLQTSKQSAAIIARQNPFFDVNKDGKLTVGEIKRRMYESIPKAIVAEVMAQVEKKSLN